MNLATLTAKAQVKIPKVVGDALELKRSYLVSWELEGETVYLKVMSPIELGYLRGVQAELTEWGSDEVEGGFALPSPTPFGHQADRS